VRAMPELPGTEFEEFSDFELASKPKRRPFTFDQFVSFFIGAVLVFWAVIIFLIGMHWFRASSSDNLILGTWHSSDDPMFLELRFAKGGLLGGTNKKEDPFEGRYYFLAQQTIEFKSFERETSRTIQAKIRFAGAAMTMTETTGVVSHWRRH
jgi:hypothetical protein